MKFAISVALVVFTCLAAAANENSPLWVRYPAISLDGQTLLFEYRVTSGRCRRPAAMRFR
jgi:hypothetical protein